MTKPIQTFDYEKYIQSCKETGEPIEPDHRSVDLKALKEYAMKNKKKHK